MEWNKLISTTRLGKESEHSPTKSSRTEFQRDYDRIIFSSPFRRLQNKTQVFPLPGSVFVHNRLTHSLEVASIGRSLGNMLSEALEKNKLIEDSTVISEIGSIVATACLAHDLGNPPFGHSGEKAISKYFTSGQGVEFKKAVEPEQWTEFENFEGNANAFRLLAHQFSGRRKGGYALTYSSLSAVVKYPFPVGSRTTKNKYGYFQSEYEIFESIAHQLQIACFDSQRGIYARHPLVYLVEAADDIAYQIMDIEDAQKLGILNYDEACGIYEQFLNKTPGFDSRKEVVFEEVTDKNEQIAYLRASVINVLVHAAVEGFIDNYPSIMNGTFNSSLTDCFDENLTVAMRSCAETNFKRVYNHPSVVKIELAGYNIINFLLEQFVPAVIDSNQHYYRKLHSLIPEQYNVHTDNTYHKIQSVIDFISGMTDLYATELYRDIKGINAQVI